jgi:CRP/FNR family transcriptional regulator, cyclic AMP receptor protein
VWDDLPATDRSRLAGQIGGGGVATREEIADILAGFALFGDLQTPQLLAVAGVFQEVFFPEGERVLRQGLTASGLYVILEGSADITIDGTRRATIHRGDYFGEVSILLGEPPTADVVAVTPLSCLSLGGPAVEGFLLAYPRVMFRMLQAQARRLRNANRWRS